MRGSDESRAIASLSDIPADGCVLHRRPITLIVTPVSLSAPRPGTVDDEYAGFV